MKHTIDNLSAEEFQLYSDTIALEGTIESKTLQLIGNGTFDKYRVIHKNYFELYSYTNSNETRLETIKRLTFLNWYSKLEPGCFTGIENLDDSIIFNSYAILNDYIIAGKLDEELNWMLSYYSSWDWIILTFSENNLKALTNFVRSVDTSVLHVPKHQLPKGAMGNRGQMGIYWTSCSVEKV